jgi:hypothetical protein
VIRADLLALTPEALARLANVGLVKRAQKEVLAGVVTALTVEPDGTVLAVSKDGATTRLPANAPLGAAPCTCGAIAVCRHRLAAVLAYQQEHGAAAVPPAPWDPGAFTDAEIAATCGAGGRDRRSARRRRGDDRDRGRRHAGGPAADGDRDVPGARLAGLRQVRLQQGRRV